VEGLAGGLAEGLVEGLAGGLVEGLAGGLAGGLVEGLAGEISRECLQDKLDKVATGASEKRSPISRTRVNMAIRRRGTLRYYADIRESAVI